MIAHLQSTASNEQNGTGVFTANPSNDITDHASTGIHDHTKKELVGRSGKWQPRQQHCDDYDRNGQAQYNYPRRHPCFREFVHCQDPMQIALVKPLQQGR